jgi:hypothetical protein
MPSETFTITLSGLSDREREKAAAELARVIKQSDPSTDVERRQDNTSAMDFGATLVVIVGSGAGIAIARGIQAWMGRWKNARIILSDGDHKVEIERVSSDDVIRAVELFTVSSRKQ